MNATERIALADDLTAELFRYDQGYDYADAVASGDADEDSHEEWDAKETYVSLTLLPLIERHYA